MPEGDTLARIATVLSRTLVGQQVLSARGRSGGADLARVVGRSVESVVSRGKHLLIGFTGGLTLHTHLGLHGSWHRYRPGEAWRRSVSRAGAILETGTAVCVCFDAPTVELLDTRAVAIHPALARLGPDVARSDFDVDAAVVALREPHRAQMSVGDALLDQRAVAGFGNVYRSELCFIERINPHTPLSEVDDDALRRVLEGGARLVAANSAGGARVTTSSRNLGITSSRSRAALYVYGRTARPCRRCGTLIRSQVSSARPGSPPRRVYWCPRCQPVAESQSRESRGGHGRAMIHGTTAHSSSR